MDPEGNEIHIGNDHASGLLQTPLLHTTANLPVVESTYTLCAIHFEHSVEVLPKPINPKSLSPTEWTELAVA